jgi:hypothetical protein
MADTKPKDTAVVDKPVDKPVDKSASRKNPAVDGLRLLINWQIRHNADVEFVTAATNILARMDEGAEPGSTEIEVFAPPTAVQQHIGHGQYVGVEDPDGKKVPEQQAPDLSPAVTGVSIPQIGGVDAVGQPLPGAPAQAVAEQVSVQDTSQSTAQPVPAKDAPKDTAKK